MDGEGVAFDGVKMTTTAEGMEKDLQTMQETYQEAMDALDQEIGREETGNRAWYGQKAELFMENVKASQPAFDTIHENVKTLAQNLKDQAQAWIDFENQG